MDHIELFETLKFNLLLSKKGILKTTIYIFYCVVKINHNEFNSNEL